MKIILYQNIILEGKYPPIIIWRDATRSRLDLITDSPSLKETGNGLIHKICTTLTVALKKQYLTLEFYKDQLHVEFHVGIGECPPSL